LAALMLRGKKVIPSLSFRAFIIHTFRSFSLPIPSHANTMELYVTLFTQKVE
jgi:hypothetical protein